MSTRSAVILLGMLLSSVLGCGAKEDNRAKVVNAVASAAGASAVGHGLVSTAEKNPVSATTALLYGCIAEAAAAYWPAAPHSFEAPPSLSGVSKGADAGWDRQSGDLKTSRQTIGTAPAGRLICLHGERLGFLKEQNLVTFDGIPAPSSPRSSKSTLCTAVPLVETAVTRDMKVRVHVGGVPSNTIIMRVTPAVRPSTAPFIVAKRLLAKEFAFVNAIANVDWDALESASGRPIDPHERKATKVASLKMSTCAKELERKLKAFDTELNRDARLLELREMVLETSPEIELGLERATRQLASAPRSPR